jgi:hypothetical protein
LARSRANDTRGLVRSTVPVTSDMRVWALQPEIAADLDSLEVTAHRPDGGTEILLYARDVSARWPTPFILKKPLLLRRGTQVSFIARSKDSSRDPGARMLVARY